MNQETNNHYRIVEKAIAFIRSHAGEQPSLDQIANSVHLSSFHFQKLFRDWAGISPKQFLQALTLQHAQGLLAANKTTLFETAMQSGLSGTGRLHDLFVKIEGMTPTEYRSGGENLHIRYTLSNSPFGLMVCACTPRGVCVLQFIDHETEAVNLLREEFPNAKITREEDGMQEAALKLFRMDWQDLDQIKLHLKASAFQLKVWQCLLSIREGQVKSYASIATQLGNAGAARAVGTAIGKNPIAFIIPCHRVIQSGGALGGYRWGLNRKQAMLAWESTKGIEPKFDQ